MKSQFFFFDNFFINVVKLIYTLLNKNKNMDENLLLENNHRWKVSIWAIIFLILVTAITALLFWANYYFWLENEDLTQKTQTLQTSIDWLNKNKNIKVAQLLKNYKWELEKLERNSDIVAYMDHLTDISRKYKLSFTWFSMRDWELKTEVEARKIDLKSSETPAYKKVAEFIKWYREDENALFDLKFINTFEWMNEIKFAITLKVKDPKKAKTEESTENTNSQKSSSWTTTEQKQETKTNLNDKNI